MRLSRMLWVGLLAGMSILLAAAVHGATLDPPPTWTNGTLIGPARQSAELVKATFTYDAETQKLKFKLGDKLVEMTRGSTTAKVNDKTVTLPVAPKVLNGTTYVPLKNLFIGLGLEVKPHSDTAWIVCTGTLCIRLEVPKKPK
jgi:hypothetical protein